MNQVDSRHSPIQRLTRAAANVCTLNRDREYAALKRMLELKSTDRVLDLGCGDGFWTSRIAPYSGQVTGLDPDEKSLNFARHFRCRPNITYVQGFAESLPFPDGSFDKIISVSCVEHFADPLQSMKEMARVLSPGGRIALSIDSLLAENSGEAFRQWHKRRHYVTQYFDQQTLTEMLSNAGFRTESRRIVHLFRSRFAGMLRAAFIRRPRLWLPLFPAFYLSVRVSDRLFDDHHGQILVVTGSVRKH